MKDLAALKAAKRAAEAAAKKKREEDLARENEEFANIAGGAADPAEVYRIMAKRHAREMEDLEQAFFRDQEMAKLEKQNKIREERMKLRENITDPEELAKFDAETERLLAEAAKMTPEDQLELIRRKNELKERQMKEVQDALEKLSPEYAMKLDAERKAQQKAEMEKASREEAAKAMALEIERQKKEKLRRLEQLEAEQRRKDEEMAKKAQEEAAAERAKLEKRKAMEEKRLEQKTQSKIREAASDEDVDQLMADLNAQKDILNAKYANRHAAHRKQIEERLRARQVKNAQKAQLEAELSDLNQLDFSLPTEEELREQVLQLDVSEYAANPLAILKELPVMKSIQEFEKRIAEQMTLDANKPVKGSIGMPFIDVFDIENPTNGELSVIEKCPEELKPNFEMATRLMDELCSRVNAQIPTLLIAETLPHTNYSHNVFRNSYFFDSRANLGYIHVSRMREPGQLALLIAHFAAHLKVNEFTNDSDLGFLSAFFETIRILLHLSAKTTSMDHSRAAADHDLLESRVYGPALSYQPIKDGIVNLRYDRKKELAVAEQPSRAIMQNGQPTKATKSRHRDHLTELEGETNLELEQLRKGKALASKAGEKQLAEELEILIQEKIKMIEGIHDKA
ncbi:Oidioi.mRNA.OKI2018_I69.chr2.g6892.t1.cds [Oikopleura dioica]|uniref:Oidioi.mRNA.OKI2018_I69.chr2.g6892.t1.cds n=1 Tax=Oikopleura dioica TaxID=34765 RepID=A0ABN7T539_OIKDI|nr:Oidioi.mRNA.OKI2018_I69.chr2.g6892.t1.cds [Oikopleura dioica]